MCTLNHVSVNLVKLYSLYMCTILRRRRAGRLIDYMYVYRCACVSSLKLTLAKKTGDRLKCPNVYQLNDYANIQVNPLFTLFIHCEKDSANLRCQCITSASACHTFPSRVTTICWINFKVNRHNKKFSYGWLIKNFYFKQIFICFMHVYFKIFFKNFIA